MKVTVEISDKEMQEVLELTGETQKGHAIRQLLEEALQLRRRAQIVGMRGSSQPMTAPSCTSLSSLRFDIIV